MVVDFLNIDLPQALPLDSLDPAHYSLGLNFDEFGQGTFAVFSRAKLVQLCFVLDSHVPADLKQDYFKDSAQGLLYELPTGGFELRFDLTALPNGMHVGRFAQLKAELRYGLRAFGNFNPATGEFFNPQILLLDPYAKAVITPAQLGARHFGHVIDEQLKPVLNADGNLQPANLEPGEYLNENLGGEFYAVATATPKPLKTRLKPTAWQQSIIYELHVKGFSTLNPLIPEPLRGTYAGLAHPESIAYLRSLGVSAVELLPIQAAVNEPHLQRLDLVNYWGYNTAAFFAPNPDLATAAARKAGPNAVLAEVQEMISALHEAGIEVILDVVYNHSAEGDLFGPTLSFKGLGAGDYYFFHSTTEGKQLVNTTGTGNTLNADSLWVQRLVLDSLRFWAEVMGADGFRFDLATALGRSYGERAEAEHQGDPVFSKNHALLRAILLDPVLRTKKLIAEPWDIGFASWQSGNFGAPWRQWNDAYRDLVRRFWLTDSRQQLSKRDAPALANGYFQQLLRELAQRLSGSESMYATANSPEQLSINFICAHDGFTLHDLTAYNFKHNEANGEANRDGSNNNFSFNHGFEGLTYDQSKVAVERDLTARNLLATLFLSAGTPMLVAGDEVLRSAGGNNNAYCHDNELNYLAWRHLETATEAAANFQVSAKRARQQLDFTRELIKARTELPQLNPSTFFRSVQDLTQLWEKTTEPLLAWLNQDGSLMQPQDWFAAERFHLIYAAPGTENLALVVINQEPAGIKADLSQLMPAGASVQIMVDSALGKASFNQSTKVLDCAPNSVVLFKIESPSSGSSN